MTSNNSSSFNSGPETVQGSGNWAPGTTVREIEGHFHKDNEPQGVAPISQTGGVPKVDYNPSTGEKIKDTLSGHSGATSSSSHGTHGTGSGLTGSHHSSSNTSGLTGSHNNNNHDNRSATEKMKDAVTPGSSTSHNTSGTGHSGSSAYNTGSTTGTGAGAGLAGQHNNRDTQAGLTGSHGLGGNSSSSHHDSRSTGDKVRDTVGGHPGYGESPSDVNRTTGSSTTGSGLSGSHPTSSHGGATHGISDNAQRELNSTGDSSRKTGLGATGDHSQQGHGMGTTTATGTAAPNSRAGDAANKLEGSLTGRDNVSGSNTEARAADKLTGAGGAHDSAPESKFGSGGHHGSSDSPAGVHNSTTQPQKEGVFDKIKHAIGK